MKESPTEPPQKKLKQARLPFQILSPPVVKNVESPQSQCKRKASEVTSTDDNDVVVNEKNENNIKPVEKKAKIVKKDKDQEKEQNSDVCMEIEKEERVNQDLTSKRKTKSTNNSGKKASRSISNRRSSGKNSSKVRESISDVPEKKDTNTPDIVDYVDLCDSPVKKSEETNESSSMKHDLKNKVGAPVVDKNESIGNDKSDLLSLCAETDKTASNSDLTSPYNERDCEELTKVSEISCNKSLDSIKCIGDCENEGGSMDKITKKDSSSKKEKCAPESKKLTKNKKSPIINKNSPIANKNDKKQPSIKDLVTSVSQKMKNDSSEENQSMKSDSSTDEYSDKKSLDNDSASRRNSPVENTTTQSVDESNFKTPTTENDSMSIDDSSPSSECNTSSFSTPMSDKKNSKTPRRMTPKQLLKLKEKEEKKKEKERLKEEKEKKKAEEKEEKQKIKKEKEEERLRLKQEKEDEKRKEKEEKEKKKQAELDKKNEEKRLKEEEKRQKEEEKQAKEEEEKKRKEEKRLKEEQKEAEKRKSAQAFASFFVKSETKPVSIEEDKGNTLVETNFQPFEVKNDMRLAPVERRQLAKEDREFLDSVMESSAEKSAEQRLYLEQIHSPSYICGSALRTWPPPDETEDEIIIIESENPNEEMDIDENEVEKKPEKRRHRAKLLQFHENRRPPYWGTWRKKSKNIRPRAPLNQDEAMLEYEVDSDDEWEEPGEGESLQGSEDEESQDDDQYEEDNDMFVPHGYLSDGEGEDELDDMSPESMKARLMLMQEEFEAERKEKQRKLKPRMIGCVWFSNPETNPVNVGTSIPELFLQRMAVWEGSLPVNITPLLSSPSTQLRVGDATDTPGDETKSGGKKKLVKETLVPDIIKLVHGSRRKLSKLLVEILEGWDKEEAHPSKNALAKKIRELAAWGKPAGAVHHCWFVKEDVRKAYGLAELDLPSPPITTANSPFPSNITKFTKVLTTDERLKLLRESPAVSKELAKNTVSTTSSPPALKTPSSTVKIPTVKLAASSPVVKKRVALTTLGPRESPKPGTSASIMNFVTKSARSDDSENVKKETVKSEDKAKKRIIPITLTTTVSKPNSTPAPSSTDDECIVLD